MISVIIFLCLRYFLPPALTKSGEDFTKECLLYDWKFIWICTLIYLKRPKRIYQGIFYDEGDLLEHYDMIKIFLFIDWVVTFHNIAREDKRCF